MAFIPVVKSFFRGGRSPEAAQENIETLTGQRGNGLDRALTPRDLIDLGLLDGKYSANGSLSIALPSDIGDIITSVEFPKKPTGFKARGAFSSISLTWDLPTFSGYSYAAIFRSDSDDLGTAVQIATVSATVFGDLVDLGSAYYYWVRFVNTNNVAGPFNATLGTLATTAEDFNIVMDKLDEQLRQSPAYLALSSDIDYARNEILSLTGNDSRIEALLNLTTGQLSRQLISYQDQHLVFTRHIIHAQTATESLAQSGNDNIQNVLSADIERVEIAYTDADTALAQTIDTVVTRIDGEITAAIEQSAQALTEIDENGTASYRAMWGVKAQAGDIATAGIGLMAFDDGNGNVISQVIVSANQFYMYDPLATGEVQSVFTVSNGQVRIREAFIEEATITILNAQTIVADEVIAGISITTPTITGGTINGGELNIGPGGNYNNHHFHVDPAGNMYAQNAVISGTVYATNGTFTGNVYAQDGYFKGDITGARGTFSGYVEATQIIGDIVTARDYSSPSITLLDVGTSVMFSGSVTNARSFHRMLQLNSPITLSVQASSYSGNRTTISARIKFITPTGTYYSKTLTVSAFDSDAHINDSASDSILTQSIGYVNAGASGAFSISLEVLSSTGTNGGTMSATLSSANDTTIVNLFQRGGDLA